MFIIKWRQPGSLVTITGLRRYTKVEAEAQISHWGQYFRNKYYIEAICQIT
jgi:hypothetical protein